MGQNGQQNTPCWSTQSIRQRYSDI